MKAPFLRTPYNYDRDAASAESGLLCLDESLAQQSGKEEADINTIVRRFGLTGELPSDVSMPRSGDFTGVVDFHTAMNLIKQSEAEFLRIPAEIRAKFNNDPGQLMAFLDDDKNRDAAVEMGLVKPPVPEPHPLAVRVVAEPPAPPAK